MRIKEGELVLCRNSSCGVYCKIHLARIRKDRKIAGLCRSCGKSVQSEIQLYGDCGRDKVRLRHLAQEKQAKQQLIGDWSPHLAVRSPF